MAATSAYAPHLYEFSKHTHCKNRASHYEHHMRFRRYSSIDKIYIPSICVHIKKIRDSNNISIRGIYILCILE